VSKLLKNRESFYWRGLTLSHALDHFKIEGSNPIEEPDWQQTMRNIRLDSQDLPDRRGCFCQIKYFLSINLSSIYKLHIPNL